MNKTKINCIVCTTKKIEYCHQVCKSCIIKSGKEQCPVCRETVNLSKNEKRKCDLYRKKMIFDTFKDHNLHLLPLLNNSNNNLEEFMHSIFHLN